MRLPYQRQRVLRRMNRGLRRADPHLAAMLAIFARLTAHEAIASWEQPDPAGTRMRRSLARLGSAMAAVVAGLVACARWAQRCAVVIWVLARCRFGGRGWTAANPRALPRDP